jgi:hypothetical protein
MSIKFFGEHDHLNKVDGVMNRRILVIDLPVHGSEDIQVTSIIERNPMMGSLKEECEVSTATTTDFATSHHGVLRNIVDGKLDWKQYDEHTQSKKGAQV